MENNSTQISRRGFVRATAAAGAAAMCGYLPAGKSTGGETCDLILHNGKVVTVDGKFTIAQAIAVKGNKIVRVGANGDVLKLKGDGTKVIDLGGKLVLPGLIDSHAHSASASMVEFDHTIPDMETVGDVLGYIKSRAEALGPGAWVTMSQIFITRLKEQRYPTREEMDGVAPNNPVVFSTGPDASVNSLALKLNGIDRNYKVPPGSLSIVEFDPQTGEPTGILRSTSLKMVPPKREGKSTPARPRSPTETDYLDRLCALIADYNAVGLTSTCERNCDENRIRRYAKLADAKRLNLRVAVNYGVGAAGELEPILKKIRGVREHPLYMRENSLVRVIGSKVFLDGGMLTGSAYMLKPWGVSKKYRIADPAYRGNLFIPQERLVPMMRAAVESGIQFAAHTQGDGAGYNFLEACEEINRATPVRDSRPDICHSSFMTREAVEKAARLGVVLDLQPAWLYCDARTLKDQFGYDRLRYFMPLKSIFEAGGICGGGSDHMQKLGSLRSVNFYDPWLAMWTTITRKGKWLAGQLHPEEALSREQMIRFYTSNCAYILRQEKELGSLEAGKLADFIVIDRDILTCPDDDVRHTKVLKTYMDGRLVYDRA